MAVASPASCEYLWRVTVQSNFVVQLNALSTKRSDLRCRAVPKSLHLQPSYTQYTSMLDFCCFRKRRCIVTEFASKLYEITHSDIFRASELTGRDIHLSEAFALLWQDWFTGDVDGLWTNSGLLSATYCCMLLELIALGKITIRNKKRRGSSIYIEVIDQELTNTFLDKATFSQLLELDAKDEELASVVYRISKAIKWKLCSRRNCATTILRSLKKKKILQQDGECLGLRRLYRTINLEPHGILEKEIRRIALNSKTPDCYMRILLTFCHIADSHASKSEKLLKRYFTKNEYSDAMERIDKVTREWSPES